MRLSTSYTSKLRAGSLGFGINFRIIGSAIFREMTFYFYCDNCGLSLVLAYRPGPRDANIITRSWRKGEKSNTFGAYRFILGLISHKPVVGNEGGALVLVV